MDKKPIKILLIEDNPGDVRLLRELLKEATTLRVELTHDDRLAAGLQRLEREIFDLILLDLGLPDSQGLETFDKACVQAPDIPIVLLTGLDDDDMSIRAMQAGAQDYLIKGQIESNLLLRTIRYAIERQKLILDLRQKTNDLLYSEARFHNMIENNADSVIIVDDNGLIRFANPAAETLFGCRAEELLNRPFGFPIAVDQRTELEIKRNGGDKHPVIVEMRVTETEWENEKTYMASLRDITKRKQAEKVLQRLEMEYRTLAENSPDLIARFDRDLRHTYVNPAAARAGCLSADEYIGITILESGVPEHVAEAWEQRMRQVLETGQIVEATDDFSTPYGNQFFHTQLVPELAPDGSVQSVLSIARDITERKRAETALQEYSERLEEMVEKRTQALRDAQEKLIHHEKLAMLGQLAGSIGHELRNPLGTIKNAVYYLKMILESPGPETQEMLDILDTKVMESDQIISNLLNFARTKQPIRQTVDINMLLSQVLEKTTQLETTHIEIISQLDETLPLIQVDPAQLAIVFTNLIRNAVQAMPEKGRLAVRTKSVTPQNGGAEDHPSVIVSISDTGPGIPAENLGKLFEPLFTTKAKGIGLGLALVKMLVEGHEGSIEAENNVGAGSTFTVTLPLL